MISIRASLSSLLNLLKLKDTPPGDLFPDNLSARLSKRPLLLLQSLLTIGLSYHLLFGRSEAFTAGTQEWIVLGLFMVMAVLMILPVRIVQAQWFIGTLVLVDTVLMTVILIWAGIADSDMYLAYFLIILLASFTPSLKQMIGLSALLCAGYAVVLYFSPFQSEATSNEHFLRIPMLLILATFYGATADTLRKEHRQKLDLSQKFSALKQTEEALRASEAKLRDLVESTNDIFWEVDEAGIYTYCSPNISSILGYEPAEVIGKTAFSFMPPSEAKRCVEMFRGIATDCKPFSLLMRTIFDKQGQLITVESSGRPLFDNQGRLIGYRGADRDITERKRLEEQLRQSHKMEAVGQLAGGVAHDFNNLLTALIGHVDLLMMLVDSQNPFRRHIEEIKKAAGRAASLTHQLLAFSRRQMLRAEVLDVNTVVNDMKNLLHRVISEDIELITILNPNPRYIKADHGQLQQVIMNLAVNARDAMPSGGKLTIQTGVTQPEGSYPKPHFEDGSELYVVLSVSDTGCGMDLENKNRIFEPFFTSKAVGIGTGLGLAMVYGIIKQSAGYIQVESSPGRGATFTIYLPQVDEPVQSAERLEIHTELLSGYSETVLLVEDDPAVRELIRNVLQMSGYTVLEADHSERAFLLSGRHDGRIDLMITDVVMPSMSGRELAERLKSSRPDMKVLYISGYTDDAIVRHGVLEAGVVFLQKPFTPAILLQKARDVLDGAVIR
jgi:PAS domain S-box-containing protein